MPGILGAKGLEEEHQREGIQAPGSRDVGARSNSTYGRHTVSRVPRGRQGEVVGAWATLGMGSCHPPRLV